MISMLLSNAGNVVCAWFKGDFYSRFIVILSDWSELERGFVKDDL